MKLLNLLFKDRSLGYKFLVLPGIPVILVVMVISTNLLISQKEILIGKEKSRASLLANISVATLSNDYVVYNKSLLDTVIDNLSNDANVSYAMIVDSSDGRILVHSDHSHDGKVISQNKMTFFNVQNQEDESYKISKDISISGNIYATLHILFSFESVHQEIALIKKRLILIILIAVLLGSACSIILARLVSAPIKALVDHTRIIGAGNLTRKIDYKSKDLLGQLANEFNNMVVDLRKSRDALEISENRATALLDAIPDVMVRMDSDGVFLDYQAEKFNLFAEEDTIIGKKSSDLLPLQLTDLIEQKIKHTLDSGNMQTFEYQLPAPEFAPTHYEARVVKCGEKEVIAIVRNVTDRKRIERERLDALKEIRSIMETVPDIIYTCDTEGKLIDWNKSLEEMTGYSKDELQDRIALEFIHSDDRKSAADAINDVFQKGYASKELRLLSKKGESILLLFSGRIKKDAHGKVVGFAGVAKDITEIKKLEKKLQQAQKMKSIGMMAGGVAHDLNNILAGIVGYPELILDDLPQDSKFRKPIEAIHDSGKRAATVVADLLTIARGVASTKNECNLNLVAHEYLLSPECSNLKLLYPEVTCRHQFNAEHPTIFASEVHVKKCLMNLVTNAVEAIDGDGTVNVFTRNERIDKVTQDTEHKLQVGEYIVLGVKDTGSGIKDEDLEHIFEPFYTRKFMGRSGTGLGLTVVWNTMEDHNGKVIVESSDEGTCFLLYFPVATETKTEPGSDKETEDITGNGEYVLIVDDDPHLRNLGSQMLESLGYQVDSVSSGEMAVQFVQDKKVNLLVIDMLMEPGINGRQTYEEILKLYPGQKAVIASGFSKNDDVKITLQLGASVFIKKPYSKLQLGRAVKKALMN